VIDRRRVCEIYDPAADVRGSGFFLSSRLVVTAAHCAPGGLGTEVFLRNEGQAEFDDRAVVRWLGQGGTDVALLELDDDGAGFRTWRSARIGRPVSEVRWEAVGFPWAQMREAETGSRTAAEAAGGRLQPLTGMRAGTYDVQVETGQPEPRHPGLSAWGGMSGAAVFAEGAVVAILTEDPNRFGPGRLRGVPASALLEDASAAHLLARHGIVDIEPVWPRHRDVLTWPYRALATASPLLLLQYQYAALPFHSARDADLAALTAWCDENDEDVAVAVVHGVGGTGKSRLAAELCQRLRSEDWVAGFLAPETAVVEPLLTLAAMPEPRLIVVDAAETRAEQVIELARILGARSQESVLRVLLLARGGMPGEIEHARWWRALCSPRNPLQSAFLGAERRALTPLPNGVECGARADIFARAQERFAQLLDRPIRAPAPNLSDPAYDTYLFLQIGAVLTLMLDDELPVGEDDLLTAVLDSERELIWRPTAVAHGVGPDERGPTNAELDLALAVATLAVAEHRDDAVAVLQRFAELARTSSATRTADWLRTLYPGRGWFRGIRPDRLGEHHVRAVVAEHPRLPLALLEHGAEGGPERDALLARTLIVLARAAARGHRETALALEIALKSIEHPRGEALLSRLTGRLADSHAGASESGLLAQALVGALGVARVPDVADAARRRLWRSGYALQDLADVLAIQAVEHFREVAAADPSRRADLLDALLAANTALLHAGKAADVTALRTEALEIAWRLHQEAPERHARTLAHVLEVAAVGLSRDDPEAALELSYEALKVRERFPTGSRVAHSALTYQLAQAGRVDEAVEAAAEHVRRLVAALQTASQDDAVHLRGELAMALGTWALQLAESGQDEAAVHHARNAVTLAQRDAGGSPLPELMFSAACGTLARVLRRVGRADDAAAAAEEGVAALRRLDESSAEQHIKSLSSALSQLASALQDAGRHEDALGPAIEVVAISRRLAAASPIRHRPHLAAMLGNLSHALRFTGRAGQAVEAAREAVEIWNGIEPTHRERDEHLMHAYMTLAEALIAAQRFNEAAEAAMHAVRTSEGADWNRASAPLTRVWARLTQARALKEAGRQDEAAEVVYAAIQAWKDAGAPQQVWQPIVVAYQTLSQLLREAGRHEEALREVATGISLCRRSGGERTNEGRGLLANILNEESLTLRDFGQFDDARVSAREVVSLLRGHMRADMADERRRLAFMLTNLSQAEALAGDRQKAHHAAAEAVAIWEALATAGDGDDAALEHARDHLAQLSRP
jgi:tetratricopeptide (TPR) repeat protein